jgi:hypothetical protein
VSNDLQEMNAAAPMPERVLLFQRRAMWIGAVALVLCLVAMLVNPTQFFRSWLFGWLFWLSFPLGCMALLMLHHLTGGGWGTVIRGSLEAATRTLPLVALLFVPFLAGTGYLYEWTHAEKVAADPVLQHKEPYLNLGFFWIRAAVYFAVWLGLAHILNKWSRAQYLSGQSVTPRRLQLLSGPGILLYGLTMSFAAFDWAMSLEAHWFSTMYGLLFIAGQALTALAFAVALLVVLASSRPLSDVVTPVHLQDLGNLMLALVMFWAYLAFSQYLIIWSGNLPEFNPWYVRRAYGGYGVVALLLIGIHFALPFLVLLSRRAKRSPRMLWNVAVLILVMRLVDVFWTLAPSFNPDRLFVHWMDLAAPVAIGGMWITMFVWQLGRGPLLQPARVAVKPEPA